MAEIIRMPKLSDTMTEGVVVEWHKQIGEKVETGELLAEIETDKATMEFESFYDGILLYIGVEKGKNAPVDSVLCILGEKGEDYNKILENENKENTILKTKETEKQEVKLEKNIILDTNLIDKWIKISPLAKKISKEKNINLSQVKGTGEGGRIIKRDIDNFQPNQNISFASILNESFTEKTVSQMRKTIAKRLSESKFSAPHFYLTIEINMDNLIEARKIVNNNIKDTKISFNDFVVKAVASALKKHPKINTSWLNDKIRFNQHINIGIAVAVDEGLLVPVIRFADTKSITTISAEVKQYAQRAKDKKLQPKDWEGSTFTISNLGMYGIEQFTAIINPPDACIMAIGGITQKPVVKNGEIVVGNIMKVTLSSDHRVVDGATASEFLNTFKGMLENPVMMII